MAPSQDKLEPIMERYIPANSSNGAYRAFSSRLRSEFAHSSKRLDAGNDYNVDVVGDVRDDSILDLSRSSIDEGSTALSSSPSPSTPSHYGSPISKKSSGFNTFSHREAIADALDFKDNNRVFKFSPNKSPSINEQSIKNCSMLSYVSLLHPKRSLETDAVDLVMNAQHAAIKKARKHITTKMPCRVLGAQGLRNDFYSNLITWSKSTGKVAVGLGCNVYMWAKNKGSLSLDLPDQEFISCVSFSDGDLILVATKSGRISLFSQESLSLLDEYFNVGDGCSACCITWFPNSTTKFAVGVERGEVYIFEIAEDFSIVLLTQFKSNQQQVCGIAITDDSKQMSIGGNDNCCTIWDLEDQLNPKLKYFLPHQAAVKAIAYCPWSKSILATGGGSRDRTIRFWHTNSGTLLDSIKTSGQITSLTWSRSKKQIAATFGFTGIKSPTMVSVYSYPKLNEVTQVEGSAYARVLSAALSPDSSSICVASNDEAIRFFKIWDPSERTILENQDNGLFGSDLIEMSEGISIIGGTIR